MQVENALFKVHATQLSHASIVFEEMFAVGNQLPPMEGMEGSNNDHPIVIPELSMNMFELFLSVAYSRTDLKELLDEHNHIVACKELPIIKHSPYCMDNTACFIDWQQLWWNSMAHFLLDGRNPQKFHEAIEHFQELGSEIGRVNPECWKMLLQTVKKGTAFHLAFDLVEETAQQLSAALIMEPGPMLTRAELDTLGLPSHEENL
ncbi:hypothetical protein BDR05DRAFT_1021526 [Suillus weaverae]|nr:hypothetical protein BDR05DRAFT_1021526 [Suillus weaverae]